MLILYLITVVVTYLFSRYMMTDLGRQKDIYTLGVKSLMVLLSLIPIGNLGWCTLLIVYYFDEIYNKDDKDSFWNKPQSW